LVYVELVIAAPWNKVGAAPRRYYGVGTVLLRRAVSESMRLGWEGRVGLESLNEESSKFYRKLGMKDFGPAANGMHRFEFDPDSARLQLL